MFEMKIGQSIRSDAYVADVRYLVEVKIK